MSDRTDLFFKSYFASAGGSGVFVEGKTPVEMMETVVDDDGWYKWKLIPGTLQDLDYRQLENEFNIQLPQSFINWHKQYYFLDADCALLRLPASNPLFPLGDLKGQINWALPQDLAVHQLYAFGDEGNDAGPLVFDGRNEMPDNEFPIRVYEHDYGGDLDGLSEVIFSSFGKLLECVTHFLVQRQSRHDHDIIPDFFDIDPTGAGDTGRDYWLSIADMFLGNFEYFGES